MPKTNKKIITVFALIFSIMIMCGVVFAFQKNVYSEMDNKDLLEKFDSDRIRNTQIDVKNKIEDQERSITQEIDFVANIGKRLFGIEREKFFRPINKIMELKNFKEPKTINVPGDYSKIQPAIDNANFGDTIKVASGEYMENIIMKEGISLIGSNELVFSEENEEQNGSTALQDNGANTEDTKETFANVAFVSSVEQMIINETTINGENSGNVISFKNKITNKTKLAGFTIKNSGENLSGILIEDSSPLINDNILKDNEYGIYIKGDSSPVIQKNIVYFNNKGIQAYNFKEEDFESLENSGSDFNPLNIPIIIDNLITDNKIGIDLHNFSATIDHNTISYNNHYKTYLGPTFGIYIAKSSAKITNNIITDNGICDLCAGINADKESKNVIMSYNNIWGNKNNFVCFGKCVMEDNNFSEDPRFINCVTGNFKLKEESGLIGACEDGSNVGVRW